MTRDPLHHAWCRCRACAPRLIGQRGARLTAMLIYGPGFIAIAGLIFLLVNR